MSGIRLIPTTQSHSMLFWKGISREAIRCMCKKFENDLQLVDKKSHRTLIQTDQTKRLFQIGISMTIITNLIITNNFKMIIINLLNDNYPQPFSRLFFTILVLVLCRFCSCSVQVLFQTTRFVLSCTVCLLNFQ